LPRTAAPPVLRTAPVLAIVVCHNGENWLPLALSSLRRSTVRPRHVLGHVGGQADVHRVVGQRQPVDIARQEGRVGHPDPSAPPKLQVLKRAFHDGAVDGRDRIHLGRDGKKARSLLSRSSPLQCNVATQSFSKPQ